jgi:Domain of unknown function (DUF4386)
MKTQNKLQNLAIFLLIAMMVTVTAPVIILGANFNFPDILRQPAANAFKLFRENQTIIVIGYYIFLLSSLLFIPLTIVLQKVLFQTKNKTALNLFVGFGLATAIFQCIGFVRWIFVMPFLTESYFNNPESQKTIIIIYEMLNRYAGMSIGEHLGFLVMGCWTICLGLMLLKHPRFNKWIGYVGLAIGFLLIVSILEHFGGALSSIYANINMIANTLWTIWLIVIAVFIYRMKPKTIV